MNFLLIAHCTGFRQNPNMIHEDDDYFMTKPETKPLNDPLPIAGIGRRLAAFIYDAFLLFAITLAYGLLLLLIKVIFNGTDHLEDCPTWPSVAVVELCRLDCCSDQLLLYMLA
jgi:hypothetical protein